MSSRCGLSPLYATVSGSRKECVFDKLEMPADPVGALELCAVCAHIAGTPEPRLWSCVSPDLLKPSPAGTSLPAPVRLCHGSVRPAPFAMRRDAVDFLRQSHIPSRRLPARVSGAGVSGRWRAPVGSAGEFSLCPLCSATAPCLMSGSRVCPRAGFPRGHVDWP